MSKKKRVLYIAHGHPDFSPGGAEWAAYYMYQAMKASPIYEPFLLAHYRHLEHRHAGSNLLRHEQDSHIHLLLTDPARYDHFLHTFVTNALADAGELHNAFRDLLKALRPDIIHFHHYMAMGLELFAFAKSILPDVKIVLTLHEYFPICANHGSMIKTKTNQLCLGASPLKCCGCFPERTPEDFFLRERFFKTNFSYVDHFISPSRFLMNRFVEWGLDPDRFLHMDNGRPLWPKKKRLPRAESQPFVAAFFGQIVFHKGVDVFLRAAAEYRLQREHAHKIEDHRFPRVRFAIHGGMHNLDDDNVRRTIKTLIDECEDVVHMHGVYDARTMPALLNRVDCVVIPSKWWENSPLVIQEAFMAGVPIICSNIGGMAEKVTDRVNGLHFVVGNHFDLLNRVIELAGSPALYEQLTQGIPEIISDTKMASIMHDLYNKLTESTLVLQP
jgi:glycosyltransferase involved in cell wall biosynthesis